MQNRVRQPHPICLCFAESPSGEESLRGNNVTPGAKLLIQCGIYFGRTRARRRIRLRTSSVIFGRPPRGRDCQR